MLIRFCENSNLGKCRCPTPKKIFGPYTVEISNGNCLEAHPKNISLSFQQSERREKVVLISNWDVSGAVRGSDISKKDYLKNIHGIEMILQGKKKNLLVELKKQMKVSSKNNEFEKAAEARNRIFALEHIRDVALISDEDSHSSTLGSRLPKGRLNLHFGLRPMIFPISPVIMPLVQWLFSLGLKPDKNRNTGNSK